MSDRDRFDKFTEHARRVLSLSQEEAQRFQHNYIGTEHLLLGLVREGEGVATKVLANLGVELNKVRSAVEFIIGRGDRIVLGEIGLTPRAKKVIELAVDETRRLNHDYIGTEHLLLGLVREGEGIAAGVLESLGVNLENVRTQTILLLSQTGNTQIMVFDEIEQQSALHTSQYRIQSDIAPSYDAQCESTLDNGERCSNRAVPGTRYCQSHRTITFKAITKPANTTQSLSSSSVRTTDERQARLEAFPSSNQLEQAATQSPPPIKAVASVQSSQASPQHAIPALAGQKPVLSFLRADERNILVAPQGLIWLQSNQEMESSSHFDHLVRLLGLLSQVLALPGQLKLLSHSDTGDCLLYITPVHGDAVDLSILYDTISAVARLVKTQFYIGQDNIFVQYRDASVPRGYDVPDLNIPNEAGKLLLVTHWDRQQLSLSNFTEMSLADFGLQIVPLGDIAGQLPKQVYALVPAPIYPLLVKYLRAHHLHYRLAYLQSAKSEYLFLEINPRADSLIGQVVPAFILDYLSRLPRVVLLVQAYQANDRHILLQWKHRYPLHLPNVADIFAPGDMVLLMAEHYPNLRFNPTPQFFDGDQLVDIHLPEIKILKLSSQSVIATKPVKLEILLRSHRGSTPPTSALLLSPQELMWLRSLLYRLPAEAFNAYTFCWGEEGAVLLSEDRPIEGLPFGIPLRRISERELFIPVHSRFVPDLPWSVLCEAFAISDKDYTFLTQDYRLDLPKDAFINLSRALVAEPDRPRVRFTLHTISTLSELHWTPPPVQQEAQQGKTRRGLSFPLPRPTPTGTQPEVEFDVASYWREQARKCEKENDFLTAAVCYNFLNDKINSARCYRQMAATLQLGEQKRG